MTDAAATPETPSPRPRTGVRGALVAVVVVTLAVLGLAAGVRYGVLLPEVRLLIEARTDGLKIGRVGRLKIEGLSGDLWRDVSARRLTIRDEKGVWLEARDVRLKWRYLELLRRRFDADLVQARTVRIVRRPTLTPKGKDSGLPVSFHIERLATRLEMEPAFSYVRGVYDLTGALDVRRRGGQTGRLRALSVLHPGDRLALDFALGRKRAPFHLRVDGREAQGGALAGAIGLPADQPFELTIRADGTTSAGRFTATALSGAGRPLAAQGAWTPQGGDASGRLSLTASSMTAPLAERLGPQLAFTLSGRKGAPGGLFALDANLRTDAISARIYGPGDLGKRKLGREGLIVDARAASLSRVIGAGKAGAAHVVARITGVPAAWKLAGSADVREVGAPGYGLARVSGPLSLEHGRGGERLQVRLDGAGGRGEGLLAAWLGGAPRLALDAERTDRRQLILRRLDLTGAGMKIAASGGRSLLGASTLKGSATLTNLAVARPRASGTVVADFQASQDRAGGPWALSASADGRKFALGMAELDRLLGAEPRVKLAAQWQDGRLAVSDARLNGAALDLSATGALERDRRLAFKAQWSAEGPFRAGPVEISGKARGTGAVAGTLAAPRLDLAADFDQIDVPRLPLRAAHLNLTFQRQADGSNGSFDLAASSPQGPARARSAFRFPTGGVDLTDLSVDAGGLRADGDLSLRRRAPSSADLRLEIGRGAFLDAGRLGGTLKVVDAGAPRLALDLSGENVRAPHSTVTARRIRLTAEGPVARFGYRAVADGVSEQGPWSLDGRGEVADLGADWSVGFDGGGKLGGRDLRTTETAVFRFGGPVRSARLRLASAERGRLALDALLRGEDASVKAEVKALGLGLLNPDLAGDFDADLTLAGAGARLDGTLDARLTDARGRGSPASEGIDGVLRARLADSSLTLDLQTQDQRGLRATANLVLPAEASAAPFRVAIARQRPMRGRFSADGEIRPLFDIAVGGDRALAGHVKADGEIFGSLSAPRARGVLAVDGGRFDDGATGLSLRDVVLNAAFTEDEFSVSDVRATDGHGGRVGGQGRISLAREGVSSFRLDLKGFRLIDNETATASATGQATINRTADGLVKLSGDLSIDRADVAADPPAPSGVVAMDVKEINRPDSLQVAMPTRARQGGGWALDVTLKAPRRVFLKGRGLDIELSLDAHVGGTTAQPDLTGTARVVRGAYDFAGKRFEFDDRSVVYLSTRPQNIRLQLDAVREDPTLTVTVRIRGTAERPEVSLSSSPSLPDDEILSKMLFERSASQLSAVEAAQIASALSAMAGGGGLDLIGNLKAFAGLDRLAFAGDGSAVTVSGGKYLTDDVYLELTGGGREGPSAQVEWRIRRHLSILSKFAGQGGNRLAVRWRKDY